ncbi:unnamed protein product [Orchesella dallaii]|uniref:Uncharacterized protein n=1 Tax=Orchesella dallaii TaxID=48710 RepID=A0ABP1R2D1_9HEXA
MSQSTGDKKKVTFVDIDTSEDEEREDTQRQLGNKIPLLEKSATVKNAARIVLKPVATGPRIGLEDQNTEFNIESKKRYTTYFCEIVKTIGVIMFIVAVLWIAFRV